MWLLILEALGALALLGLAVWWTMFSGRRSDADDGRQTHADDPDDPSDPADPGPASRPPDV